MVSSFNRNVMLSPSTVRHNLFYSHLEEGSVNGEAVEAEPYVSVPYLMREVVATLKAGPKVHHLQYPIISRTNLRDPLPS